MAQELLAELHRRGIKLRMAGDRLDVVAPAGSLTPELRDRLRSRRDDLIAALRGLEPDRAAATIVPRPAENHEPFPLTDIQHAYWVGRSNALELGGVSTHVYLELERDGLDPRRLQDSLRKVIERHDMLRAVVLPDGTQRILADVPPYDLVTADLRGLGLEARDEALARTRAEMDHQVLSAERWPLFDIRASLLDDRLRLHISLDTLIVDGYSMYLFFADWRRFYEEPDLVPEPMEIAFRDHVMAEEEARTGPGHHAAERYWLDRLAELPAAPQLPLAIAPARLERTEFSHRAGRLPRERWQVVKLAARRYGLTPSVVLATAYADVLRAWSDQRDFTLDLTLFNRPQNHPKINDLIGDFTSVTLLAVRGEPDGAFAGRAGRLQGQLMRDLTHLSFSGIRVLRERSRRLGSGPGASMPVVFTSSLVLGSEDDDPSEGVRFFGEEVHRITQTPQVWLDQQVFEEQGELVFTWDAVEALFPGGLLDDMFAAYCGLLERLGTDDGMWDRAEAAVTLPDWQLRERRLANDTAKDAPPARTLCELVEERALAQPDAVAVVAEDGSLTYGEAVTGANRLARRLIELGVAPGTLVGVVAEKGTEQVTGVLGVTRSGAAYLPVDPQWPPARRHRLLERGRVEVVVTTPRLRDELDWPDGIRLLTSADPEVRGADPAPPGTAPEPGDLAYVIFTSGSTGEPKGVMIDHRGAANTVQDINARFDVGPADRVLALSSLSFDLSVWDIFGVLAAGGTVIMPSRAGQHDPAHWSALVAEHHVTIWNSVPALMQAWTTSGPAAPALRLALLSGDWIPVALPDAVRDAHPGAQVISLGGATEASIWSVCFPIGKVPADWTRIPYGRPLAGQTLHVYDERLRPCPVWATGEICIGGTGVAMGYWADPERTAERFVVHPETGERLYRTGDRGRYLPGGDIEFLGREDHQVKVNGYRIELGEIEAALHDRTEVADVLVTVETNPKTGGRQLVACVVPSGTAPVDPPALRRALEDVLPGYMVPHHYLPIDRIPLSANGKVDRSALPSPWTDLEADGQTAPRDAMEHRLLQMWNEALGRDDFGVEDNFFELGGDSLHAVRILARVREELGIEQEAEEDLEMLFDNPTIAELAATLSARTEA
jgi:pyochelin synthetase